MLLEKIKSPTIRQYVVIFTVNFIVLSIGVGLAWSSPMLVKLRSSTETTLGQPITDEEGSWIVSAGFLIGSLLNFMPTILLDRLGRKYSILVGGFPKVVGAILMLFATEVWMLILGRILSNISDMFLFTLVPTYASEISSKEIRGSLSTVLQVMCSLGSVIMLSVGPFVSYVNANILQLVLVVVALMPVPFLPESPFYLYLKERTIDSVEVLTLLRGTQESASDELKEYAAMCNSEKLNKMAIFRNRTFWKSLGMVVVLMVGAQFIGFHAVLFYLQTVLESTRTSISPEMCSVVIGVVQLLSGIFTAVTTDRFGRKPILFSSLIGMMVGMICLGTFFYIRDDDNAIFGFMNFLPLIGILLVVVCFSIGPGSVNWAVSSELFDNNGRAVGLSITMILSGTSTFFVTRFFPPIVANIGPATTYWAFGVNCFLLCTFVVTCIPETKGKSFIEIQRSLGAVIPVDEEKAVK